MADLQYNATAATANMPVGLPELDAILAANLRPLAKDPKRVGHLLRRVRETLEGDAHDLSNLRSSVEELKRDRSRKGAASTLNPLDALRFVSAEEMESVTDRITRERLRTLRTLIDENMTAHNQLVMLTQTAHAIVSRLLVDPAVSADDAERLTAVLHGLPDPDAVTLPAVPAVIRATFDHDRGAPPPSATRDAVDEVDELLGPDERIITAAVTEQLGDTLEEDDVDDTGDVLPEPFAGTNPFAVNPFPSTPRPPQGADASPAPLAPPMQPTSTPVNTPAESAPQERPQVPSAAVNPFNTAPAPAADDVLDSMFDDGAQPAQAAPAFAPRDPTTTAATFPDAPSPTVAPAASSTHVPAAANPAPVSVTVSEQSHTVSFGDPVTSAPADDTPADDDGNNLENKPSLLDAFADTEPIPEPEPDSGMRSLGEPITVTQASAELPPASPWEFPKPQPVPLVAPTPPAPVRTHAANPTDLPAFGSAATPAAPALPARQPLPQAPAPAQQPAPQTNRDDLDNLFD